MNNSQFLYTRTVQTLQRTDPQVKVRIHRIFHKYRNVSILQGICNLLHEERIGCSPCAKPHQIHTELQALEDVLLASYLCRDLQSVLSLCLLHPSETL